MIVLARHTVKINFANILCVLYGKGNKVLSADVYVDVTK